MSCELPKWARQGDAIRQHFGDLARWLRATSALFPGRFWPILLNSGSWSTKVRSNSDPIDGKQGLKSLVCRLGLLMGALFVAWPGSAMAGGIVILDGLALPDHMSEVRERIRSALDSAALTSGRRVVPGIGPGWCASDDCFRAVGAASGATEIMAVSGGRNENEGWHVAIEVRGADGVVRARREGGCDVCSGGDLVASAGALATSVLALVASGRGNQAETAPLASTRAPGAPEIPPGRTSSSGSTPMATNHLTRSVAIAGVGVATAAAGGLLWWLDGRGTDCETDPMGGSRCPAEYRTARFGIPILAGGAAIALAGVILIAREPGSRSAAVGLGPGALVLAGRF
jgi:hypothetical protein